MKLRFRNITLLLLATLLATGCSSDEDAKKAKKDAEKAYVLYSPNGEPLNGGILGHPKCEDAMIKWFDRVDANHDGFIDKSEFTADAHTQFTAMDIDKNGYLVSEELDRYRAPFRTDMIKQAKEKHKRQGPQQRLNGKPDELSAADIISQTNLIDPVMSADANLDFKVTPEEFLAQSAKNFNDLDSQHAGKFSKPDALKLCNKDSKPSD